MFVLSVKPAPKNLLIIAAVRLVVACQFVSRAHTEDYVPLLPWTRRCSSAPRPPYSARLSILVRLLV